MANMQQPVLMLMPEGSNRILGRDAQRTNISIGYAIAGAVRTTLGPRGLDKMLVSELGDIVITNDGATILEEMSVEHPVAKIMVEIAKTQDKEVGDGTTTAVVIAGELLKKAGELLDQDVHPITVITGYKKASAKCIEILNEISEPVTIKDKQKLEEIASIAMGSKSVGTGNGKNYLAVLIVKAIQQVAEVENGKVKVDQELIKLEKKEGGGIEDSTLIQGVLVDKEMVHSGMPKKIRDAKILLVDSALEIEKTETDAKININSPEQMDAFLKQEEKMIKDMVDKIEKSGATVVFCQKGIDDLAQHYLAKKGIAAVRRVKKSDMDKMARATGAKLTTNLDDISQKDLGYAGMVEEKKIAGEAMMFVENCKDPKSVTLFIRAGTEHVVNEGERAVKDAIGAVTSALEDGKYVYGGGSTEVELAVRLRKFASEIGGREQLAITAFADALEVIPRTLAESAGTDPIDALVALRAKHKNPANKAVGIDVFKGKVGEMTENNVIEPMKVKVSAIKSASETAEMLLKIDDIISSRARAGPPAGGMGGMGGGDMD